MRIKKHRKLIAICLACLLVAAVLQIVRAYMTGRLSDLQAGKRFAPEGGFAQISCYFAQGEIIPPGRVKEFSYKIESGLTTNAIEADAENEDARLFLTCHSAEGVVVLSRGGKTAEASAIGTGGDYFFVHPVPLVSGMYYTADGLSNDQILIDETLAWQLFGGNDIAGQTVDLNGMPHVVRGVVKTGDGRMREAAGNAGALVYLPVETLLERGIVRGTENSISCFEAVLPNPVRSFAADLVRKQLGFDETEIRVADHATRFDIPALWRVLSGFGTRSMAGAMFLYPYWENLARGTEDILALVVLLQGVLLCVPVVCAVVLIVRLYKNKKWTAQGIYETLSDRVYEAQAGRQRNRHARL